MARASTINSVYRNHFKCILFRGFMLLSSRSVGKSKINDEKIRRIPIVHVLKCDRFFSKVKTRNAAIKVA